MHNKGLHKEKFLKGHIMGVVKPKWAKEKEEFYKSGGENMSGGGAAAGAAADLIGTILNTWLSMENMDLQRSENSKNRQLQNILTEKQWAQDAAAFQTAVADARAAGLSPLAAIDHPTTWSNAIYSDQVAPQYDASGITAGLASMADILAEADKTEEAKRHNIEEEKAAKDQLEFKTLELKSKSDEASKLIKNQNARTIYELDSKNDSEKENQSWEFAADLRKITGYTFKEKKVTTWDQYLMSRAKFTGVWAEIQKDYGNTYLKSSSSKNETKSMNANVGPLSGGGSSGEGNSYTLNDKAAYSQMISKWLDINPKRKDELIVPIYAPEKRSLDFVE